MGLRGIMDGRIGGGDWLQNLAALGWMSCWLARGCDMASKMSVKTQDETRLKHARKGYERSYSPYLR